MARYSTSLASKIITGTATIVTPDSGAFTALTGTAPYTVTLPDPRLYPGVNQTFFNSATGTVTLSTPSGNFNGTGGSGASTVSIFVGNVVSATSDGVNYVVISEDGSALVASTAAFSGNVDMNGGGATVTISPNALVINPATSSSVNNINIGANTRGSGAFTSLTANAATTLTANTTSTSTSSGTLVVTGGVGVSGAVNAGSVSASTVTGTLQTAAQPNITSVGTLSSLAVSGALTAGSFTVPTAAQPNITSLGTLTDLTVTNTITGSVSGSAATAGTASTVTTAAQPNITSVGTLTGLTVSGNINMTGTGEIRLPVGTTAQRPSSSAGSLRYNSTIGAPEQYINGAWQSLLGTSPAYPATSASAVYSANPNAGSGYYWIQPPGLSKPFQAYCKMDFGGGWMSVPRLIPEISASPVLVGAALGSGAGDMVGNDLTNFQVAPLSFLNGLTVNNSQAQTYGCPGGSYPSQIQTTSSFRTYFPTFSQVRVKVWIGTNDGNVVCATVSGFANATMITGSANILGVCNNAPNRWSDLVGQNQVAEWYGTPQSSTVLYTTATACGGAFNSRVLELYIR
jgi:hypothetical protein